MMILLAYNIFRDNEVGGDMCMFVYIVVATKTTTVII